MSDKSSVSKSRTRRTHQRTKKVTKTPWMISPMAGLTGVLLWILMMLTLHLGRSVHITDLTPGQRAPSTVQALVDFDTVNLAETEFNRERAANEVPPVFDVFDPGLVESKRDLTRVLDRAIHDRDHDDSDTPPQIAASFSDVVELMDLPRELVRFPQVFPTNVLHDLREELGSMLETYWQAGLIAADSRESGFQGAAQQGKIRLGVNGRVYSLSNLNLPVEAAEKTAASLGAEHSLNQDQVLMIRLLFESIYRPNLRLNREATETARETARRQVEPVRTLIRQGTTLMEARTRVSTQTLQDMQAHQEKLVKVEDHQLRMGRITGTGIYLAIALAVSLFLMVLLKPDLLAKPGRVLLWLVLVEGSLLLGKVMIFLAADIHLFPAHMLRPLLPYALAPLLATILHGPRCALAVGIASSMGIALQHDLDLGVFLSGIAVTLTAALSARAIHKRSNLFRAGLWIGGIKAVMILGMGALVQVTPMIMTQQAVGAFCSGLVVSILALLLIPPFEMLFKVTTDIRLLELSDLSHPLLNRLAMEAPATYHHSLMVSHLAQTAAREIGSNDLLVRVCAYYHDIGKLTKPEFFIENIQGRQNPHDELSPSMSRLVVISHVKEGVSLAQRYKLPRVIVDGIEQHHGTSIIQYFYHRARVQEESKEGGKGKVRPEDYRYPGPKPKTPEMAILLLADSIEAASRTIDKTKPGQVEGLVNEIVKEKVNDGQLDQCGITLAQIAAVRRSFIFSLNNMLHGRIAYPKDKEKDEDRDHQPAGQVPAE